MTDRLKTVYPPKTSFCGGYNNILMSMTLTSRSFRWVWMVQPKTSDQDVTTGII